MVLGETERSAKSVIEAFRGAKVNILVQEFIKEAGGSDIRALVVGGKGHCRNETDRCGGRIPFQLAPRRQRGKPIKISPEGAFNGRAGGQDPWASNVCGVDMLRSNHGPVVMEVNSSPGLEGVEKATGIDVADRIIGFIEKHRKPGKTRTRGSG